MKTLENIKKFLLNFLLYLSNNSFNKTKLEVILEDNTGNEEVNELLTEHKEKLTEEDAATLIIKSWRDSKPFKLLQERIEREKESRRQFKITMFTRRMKSKIEKRDKKEKIIRLLIDRIEQEKLLRKIKVFSEKRASKKISKTYKEFLQKAIDNKQIADILCNDLLKKKTEYRSQILDVLGTDSDGKQKKKISNMYFNYCKFGNKSLGFEEEESVIEEIVSCVFVNVSFANTNLSKIHFKFTKFVNEGQDKRLSLRDKKLATFKKTINKTSDVMIINEHTKIKECIFENCEFFNIDFKSKLVYEGQILTKPLFQSCNFIKGSIILDTNVSYVTSQDVENVENADNVLNTISNISITKIEDDGFLVYKVTHISLMPVLVFDGCNFEDNFIFHGSDINSRKTIQNILFVNCIFTNCPNLFKSLLFKKINFNFCNFNNVIFSHGCDFNNVCFSECKIENTYFETVDMGNNGSTEFKNCTIVGCIFKNVIIHNYYFNGNTTIFSKETIINNCIFVAIMFTMFKFNFYSTHNTKEPLMNCKHNKFICCNMIGANFDNCDFEGSSFAATTSCTNHFNWLGNSYLRSNNRIRMLPDHYSGLCTNIYLKQNLDIDDNELENFKNEFSESKYRRRESQVKNYLNFSINDYYSFNINITKLQTCIKPFDYLLISEPDTRSLIYIIPPVSMFNTNIKSCKFQGIVGFEFFDFSTLYKHNIHKKKSDLTATDFTNVNLTNCKFIDCLLIGTIFEVADLKGVEFSGSYVNNFTSFQNTLNTELVLHQKEQPNTGRFYVENTKNLDTFRTLVFSDLAQGANETHARANHLIHNRNKFKNLVSSIIKPSQVQLDFGIDDDDFQTNFQTKFKDIMDYFKIFGTDTLGSSNKQLIANNFASFNLIIHVIINSPNITNNQPIKSGLKISLKKFILLLLEIKIGTVDYINKINTYLDIIIDDEFIKILLSKQSDWCWLELLTYSLFILLLSNSSYIYKFMEYYFQEVFNAHGSGSRSCVLGMVERWVLGHVPTSEAYLMDFIKNNEELTHLQEVDIRHLQQYCENLPTDDKITTQYIKDFNDKDKYDDPTNIRMMDHKYFFYKLINIIKPYSFLPENKDEDIGIMIEYEIKSDMRKAVLEKIKEDIDSEKISNIDDLIDNYISYMQDEIIKSNNSKEHNFSSLVAAAKNPGSTMNEKLKKIILDKVEIIRYFIIDQVIPDFIKYLEQELCTEDVSLFELEMTTILTHFSGGGSNKKSRSSRKTKSAPAVLNTTKLQKMYEKMEKFSETKILERLSQMIGEKDNEKMQRLYGKIQRVKLLDPLIETSDKNKSKKYDYDYDYDISEEIQLVRFVKSNKQNNKQSNTSKLRKTRSYSLNKKSIRKTLRKTRSLNDLNKVNKVLRLDILDKQYGKAISKMFNSELRKSFKPSNIQKSSPIKELQVQVKPEKLTRSKSKSNSRSKSRQSISRRSKPKSRRFLRRFSRRNPPKIVAIQK